MVFIMTVWIVLLVYLSLLGTKSCACTVLWVRATLGRCGIDLWTHWVYAGWSLEAMMVLESVCQCGILVERATLIVVKRSVDQFQPRLQSEKKACKEQSS
jgi:hypothetical protein